ncbi:uncharacterized protein LOC141597243 [Silene latifolia]|uniref:uncharacterized protein LOC141597243 n=1 Tax=Silene latifolia TaxID=37657 RepID=UPI003D76AE83
MSPAEITAEMPDSMVGTCTMSCFDELRSVKWRINLGVLPSSVNSTIDDLRRVTANSRRRYATLRRRLLTDPHITKFGKDSPDLVTDNPLSQNPDSTWGRFFRNAELEKMVDTDLSRLYPEHGSYFHTPGCQGFLRRILLLWCLQHQECGYRQGMHELLAPLIYVLHADIQRLSEIRKLHEDHFVDKFDDDLLNESLGYNFNISSKFLEDNNGFQEKSKEHSISTVLDANLQNIVSLSDPYGADGELGIVLSEKFMEHDAYSMFDALMNGSGGAVAMAEFFSHSPPSATQTGLPPVIEASLSLYNLLSIVDPSLYSHLIELGVEPQYFALRWLRVLFGREFSLEDLLVIWDEIFSFDNSKSIALEHDSAVSNSPRGAFISAMAVSMMLNVRSSLLAAELATSCLQRLLNFPEHVNLDKLLGKAKSLMPLALDANVSSHSAPFSRHHNHVQEMGVKGHTHRLSFDSTCLKTPVNVVPETYWEEKWRLTQKEEETKKGKFIQSASTQKRGWTEKIKSKLSRTESEPSPAKRESQDRGKKSSSVRRSLLDDLSRHLQEEKDIEEDRNRKLSFLEDPLRGSPDLKSPEHSPMFSEPTSPLEINSESSIVSNISNDMNDGGTQNSSFQSTTEESPLPISDAIDSNACGVSCSDDSPSDLSVVGQKDRKSLSGKFQWLWKFVRNNSGEGTSGRKIEVEDGKCDDFATVQRNKAETSVSENGNSDDFARVQNKAETSTSDNGDEKSDDFATLQENKAETSFTVEDEKSDDSATVDRNKSKTSISEDGKSNNFASLQRNESENFTSEKNFDYGNLKTDGCDQSLVFALRNLGQSMLENIQVVESAFGSERSQAGSREHISKHNLVEKGQVTVMTALNELRKISNLLQEV